MNGPKITYTGSGTEPLRSNPTTKAAQPHAPDRGAGAPVGGTENFRANFTVLAAKAAKMVKGGPDRTPPGVQSFKAGVSK